MEPSRSLRYRPGIRGRHGREWCARGIVVLLLTSSVACSKNDQQGGAAQAAQRMQMPPVPVTVAKATRRTVPVRITVIGNGEAFTTVNVKAQVDGLLQRVDFREGQDVNQGQELFAIDSAPFEAALHQAEANLARDQAQLKNAHDQFERNTALFQQGIISKDQEETFRTNEAALEATVKADQAAIENARIQLGYCEIRSPISGRTGSLAIKMGNLVKNNDAALVTINQISPIYVSFSVPEQYLDEIKQRFAQSAMPVAAAVPQDAAHPENGTLAFINNTVDATTGTVMMKASFPNDTRRLWPGQFVNVTITLQSLPNAVVVPSQAVQTGQNGKYVFVVKPDNSVDLRPVVAGVADGGDTVIEQGVADGDTVVTDGQLMLMPGGHVMVRNRSS
jgi:membrane fusion protein, multidrug efflux system